MYSPHSFTSVLLLSVIALLGTPAAWAVPYRPADDKQVLESLPTRLVSSEQKVLRAMRAKLRENPGDAVLAADLADRFYRLAQRSGDPRYVGYAQSVLAPWPPGSEAPPEIRTVRALIAQFLHDFASALKDLDAVLLADPGELGARSYRAVIHLVKADYAAARRDCMEIETRINSLVGSACLPTVDAITGRAEDALGRLKALLVRYPAAPPNERLWVLNRLAEISQRLGRHADAEAFYRQALAVGIADQYLLATYAEFLLDQKRPAEVIELLRAETRNDVLLLRLALAEKALGHPDAAAHQAMLADRYAGSRQRGDKLHLADEAIFSLHFSANATAAVRYAKENWDQLQREPSDARILLEAALAANNPAEALPALEWLKATGHQDPIILRLASQLAALLPRQDAAQAAETPARSLEALAGGKK